jgi:hypothetical protein
MASPCLGRTDLACHLVISEELPSSIAEPGHTIVPMLHFQQSIPAVLGSWKGKLTIPDNVHEEPPDDVINGFYGFSA